MFVLKLLCLRTSITQYVVIFNKYVCVCVYTYKICCIEKQVNERINNPTISTLTWTLLFSNKNIMVFQSLTVKNKSKFEIYFF